MQDAQAIFICKTCLQITALFSNYSNKVAVQFILIMLMSNRITHQHLFSGR